MPVHTLAALATVDLPGGPALLGLSFDGTGNITLTVGGGPLILPVTIDDPHTADELSAAIDAGTLVPAYRTTLSGEPPDGHYLGFYIGQELLGHVTLPATAVGGGSPPPVLTHVPGIELTDASGSPVVTIPDGAELYVEIGGTRYKASVAVIIGARAS